MRVFIAGQKEFGKAVLGALIEDGHEVPGVAVPPPGKNYDKLHVAAIGKRIPTILDSRRLRAKDMPRGIDLIVAAHAHHFLSRQVRDTTRLGAIGFHPSLLPRHRGRDAVRWTVAFSDPVTGGSVYWLDETVDGGPVHSTFVQHVDPRWNYHDLWREMFPKAVELLREAVNRIAAGDRTAIEQEEQFATWEPSWERSRLYRPDLPQLGYWDALQGSAVYS